MRNQAVIDTDKLREAAEALVQLIKFIRAVSKDPSFSPFLRASRRSMDQLHQGLRSLRAVTMTIVENLPELVDFHTQRGRGKEVEVFVPALIEVDEVLPLLLVDDPPPAEAGRPKGTVTMEPWHVYVELLARSVEAVLTAAGYKPVSRTSGRGPFARTMARALEKIEGRSLMCEPAAIAAYLARPPQQRELADIRAKVLYRLSKFRPTN